MKVAVIDLGSNSIRLLIVNISGQTFLPVYKKLIVTRLGQGVVKNQLLDDMSMKNTIKAMAEMKHDTLSFGCKRVYAFGTSALREAKNGKEFLNDIKNQIGIDVDILSGKDEALFSFKGARRGLFNLSKVLIIDIGGGSTEFSLGNSQLIKSVSLPMGAVRFTNAYFKSDPPKLDELQRAEMAVDELLSDFVETFEKFSLGSDITTIGVGGTLTTLAAICQGLTIYNSCRIHGFRLSRDEIEKAFVNLSSLTLEQRKATAGLEAHRADIILAGTLIARKITQKLNIDNIQVSESDLMEGYIATKMEMELKN